MLRTFWFVLTVLALPAMAQKRPVNLNFEDGTPGEYPTGWHGSPNNSSGFVIATEEGAAKEGGRFVTIRSADQPGDRGYGVLSQSVPAEGYQNKFVRFRAAIRVNAPGAAGKGQLWFRVDRRNGAPGFFDNMETRPVFHGGWAYYEITGEVAPDAERILFGMMFFGRGKASFDDASLTIVGDVAKKSDEPPRELTDFGLQNIMAFAKLFGVV